MWLINKRYYQNPNLSIKKLLINLIITYVLFRFNVGFHLATYCFSFYFLKAVFVLVAVIKMF